MKIVFTLIWLVDLLFNSIHHDHIYCTHYTQKAWMDFTAITLCTVEIGSLQVARSRFYFYDKRL